MHTCNETDKSTALTNFCSRITKVFFLDCSSFSSDPGCWVSDFISTAAFIIAVIRFCYVYSVFFNELKTQSTRSEISLLLNSEANIFEKSKESSNTMFNFEPSRPCNRELTDILNATVSLTWSLRFQTVI